MDEKTQKLPKIKIELSQHVEIEEDNTVLRLALERPDGAVSKFPILTMHIECRNDRTIFLHYGYRFDKEGLFLMFKKAPFVVALLKEHIHAVTDVLTGKLLWP